MGVLSTSWLATGLIHIVSAPDSRSGALGLLLLAAAGVLTLSAMAMSVAKPLPAAGMVGAALRFVLSAVHQLGAGGGWEKAAGIVGLVVTASAAYCVLAFELEGQTHVPILPTLRRGKGAARSAGAQLEGVVQEAGFGRPASGLLGPRGSADQLAS